MIVMQAMTARLKSQTSCNKGIQAPLVRFGGLSSEEDMRMANLPGKARVGW